MEKAYFDQVKIGAEFYSYLDPCRTRIKGLKITPCVNKRGFDGDNVNAVLLNGIEDMEKGTIMFVAWNEYCEVKSKKDLIDT